MVASGYLLVDEAHPIPKDSPNQSTLIGMYHGEEDPMVPFLAAEDSHLKLKDEGFEATLGSYPGLPHSVSQEEIKDMFVWLSARI